MTSKQKNPKNKSLRSIAFSGVKNVATVAGQKKRKGN